MLSSALIETKQLDVLLAPRISTQVLFEGVNESLVTLELNITVQAGLDFPPISASITVTITPLLWPSKIELGLKVSITLVARLVTVYGLVAVAVFPATSVAVTAKFLDTSTSVLKGEPLGTGPTQASPATPEMLSLQL